MYCRYCEERPSGVALTKSANRKTRLKRTLKKNVSDIYIIRYLGMVDDATNSKDTNDLITLSPISITMVAVFFVSRGSSPIRRIILYPLLCLIHFQCCLSFLSRAQSCEQYTCTNNSNIKINNCRKPFLPVSSRPPRKQRQPHASKHRINDRCLRKGGHFCIMFAVRHAAAAAVID
jgi:hypothetical protein